MASSPPVPYGALAKSADYSAGPFPPVPRVSGIAEVVVGGTAAGTSAGQPLGQNTLVVFAPREKGAAPASAAAADAERDPVAVTYAPTGDRVLTVSVGPAADVDIPALRKAAVAAVTKLRTLKVTSASFALPTVAGVPSAAAAAAIVQAAVLTNFAFDRYLTLSEKKPSLLKALHFSPPPGDDAAEAAAKTAAVIADATIFARDLSNERADEVHPARLEAVARAVAAEAGADVFVCAGEDLIAQGLHLLHAVGQSSRHAPRYVELSHKGDPASPDDVILLVGKGITFDSGGLNIKPTGSMEDMHMDKSGSAAVLGAFKALTKLGVRRNVVAVLAIAENAIGENAFKPHNIIRSHKGLTVEIKNTDAEGRLVLADALSFAQARVAPHTIIDLATLTGACIIALGECVGVLRMCGFVGGVCALRSKAVSPPLPLPTDRPICFTGTRLGSSATTLRCATGSWLRRPRASSASGRCPSSLSTARRLRPLRWPTCSRRARAATVARARRPRFSRISSARRGSRRPRGRTSTSRDP
jgi:leucyl aminopeptidase